MFLNINNIGDVIIYYTQLLANLITIIFFIINFINILKIKNVKKLKYFILAFLIMVLGFWSEGILQFTRQFAENINGKSNYDTIINIAIIGLIVSIILNIILLTYVNKKSKKLKEGGKSKCQE